MRSLFYGYNMKKKKDEYCRIKRILEGCLVSIKIWSLLLRRFAKLYSLQLLRLLQKYNQEDIDMRLGNHDYHLRGGGAGESPNVIYISEDGKKHVTHTKQT
ncbi:hypothetical protein CN457_27810 [Bacillus cereus]|nr:hypothetical protein CN457_27810 [Bacillus cereus]